MRKAWVRKDSRGNEIEFKPVKVITHGVTSFGIVYSRSEKLWYCVERLTGLAIKEGSHGKQSCLSESLSFLQAMPGGKLEYGINKALGYKKFPTSWEPSKRRKTDKNRLFDSSFGPDSPTIQDVENWLFDNCNTPVKGECGCEVEPDGKCQHGNLSWLRVLGVI